MPEVARGLIDANGHLVEAEDALLGLNMRAGGKLGAAPAVPQLATLARLASRLRVPIARGVTVADRETDLELFVQTQPDGENVRLAVAGWRERRPWRPANERTRLDLLRTDAEWRWESDAALRLGFVSIEAGVRLGFDAVGLLGKPLTELFAFEVDGAGELPILKALAERRAFAAQPARLKASGGRVLVSAIARHDDKGAFVGFAGGVTSVPSRSDQVPPGVEGAWGDRLKRALRAPLGQIVANADSIHTEADGPVGPDYAAYAGDIATAGRHLIALVDDLADLEAVERPDFRTEVEPIDLADLARRAAGLLAVRAFNAEVRIARPEPEASVPALGDFRRVLQILVNLIGNAVRYAPQGSVVTVAVEPDARVVVTDTGKGVAPEDQTRVFEKFERVDPSEPGGSGLGLYIARRLARAMDGDISVASRPGQGSCFTLQLRPDPAGDQDQRQP